MASASLLDWLSNERIPRSTWIDSKLGFHSILSNKNIIKSEYITEQQQVQWISAGKVCGENLGVSEYQQTKIIKTTKNASFYSTWAWGG